MSISPEEYRSRRIQDLEHELEVSEKHRAALVGVIENERAAWRREFDWKINAEQRQRASERKVVKLLEEKAELLALLDRGLQLVDDSRVETATELRARITALEGGITAEARRTSQEIERLQAELELAQEHIDQFHLGTCHAEPPCAQCTAAQERQRSREALTALAGEPPPGESLYIQIDRLAQFIMDEVPGEPSESQDAVDTAIRIIRTLQTSQAMLRAALERPLLGAEQAREQPWDRETLGWLVRAEWIAWAKEHPNPKASWLQIWNELTETEREVDRRIGETVAVWCLAQVRAPEFALRVTDAFWETDPVVHEDELHRRYSRRIETSARMREAIERALTNFSGSGAAVGTDNREAPLRDEGSASGDVTAAPCAAQEAVPAAPEPAEDPAISDHLDHGLYFP